jgi:hypothetical protein
VVVESAANTLTYKKLETGFSLFDKQAWIIHRIEYVLDERFNSTADTLDVALCSANTRASIADNGAFTDPAILDKVKWIRTDLGAAATGILYTQPQIVKDFTNLPGGGLIVPPTPIYGAAQGTGLAAATTNIIRFFYTVIELSTDQFWELVESRRSVTA